MTKTTIEIGTKVCGGQVGTEDYDEGEVLDIDGEEVTVYWRMSETRTTQPADLLTAIE
jgi:hypothetical protein